MNSMHDALQEALEHPLDVVTHKAGAELHLRGRDYFWWTVLGYAASAALLYSLARRSERG